MANKFYVGNSNDITLDGLQNSQTGDYINDATVTVTIKDELGVPVPGVSWPVTMTYVAASNGDYRATISEDLDVDAGICYEAEVTADGGAGLIGFWQIHFIAYERRK